MAVAASHVLLYHCLPFATLCVCVGGRYVCGINEFHL